MLGHLCFPASRSAGRRYPELPHPYRSGFRRDRDRIVHARSFRRLEDKTQVFAPGLSDHFRNRLTHTMEVSQLARTVAAVLELNEDLTEVLALAHDIGHPPFAHAGEQELDLQMRRFGTRFDHNLHALRLVERFEQRYARFPGLNLTFEVREGMAKHSRDFVRGEFPELDEYHPGLRPLLEAQLIDLADEVAYNTADLDDAYGAGLFNQEEVAAACPDFAAVWQEMEGFFPGATERVLFFEVVRTLVDRLVSGLVEGTVQAAQAAGVEDSEDVRAYPERLVRFTPDAAETNRQLRSLLRERVYSSEPLVTERRRSSQQVAYLFDFFLENPQRLPINYQEEAETEPLHRVVCDYIAGMTDGFFRREYQRLGL